MCDSLNSFGITLHSYCLRPNHYHLLIETSTGNLSKYVRQPDRNYAIYFNKKYNRVGHLRQGWFKVLGISEPAVQGVIKRNSK
jgi:REP element-mobilizing transposase RayT